jgi:hypothetical protein
MAEISASDISSGCFLVCSLRSIHSPASLACAVVAATMAVGWLNSLATSYASANCVRSCSMVLAPLRLLDANDILCPVDVLDLEADDLARPQSAAIAKAEQNARLEA